MKRRLQFSALLLAVFAGGFALALFLTARRDNYEVEQFRESITELRQRLYGSEFLYGRNVASDIEVRASYFDPAKSAGSITLSYTGGMGAGDQHLQLRGDGGLYSIASGRRQHITTIPQDQCTAFFRRVLTSGILKYNEGVLELKKDLMPPNQFRKALDYPNTEVRVSVPELKVEQAVAIYAPHVELENFPDIIELQIITQIEKEMLDLVPGDHPLWK